MRDEDRQHHEERHGEDRSQYRRSPRQGRVCRGELSRELPRPVGIIRRDPKLLGLLFQLFDFDLRLGEDFLPALAFDLLELARRVRVFGDGFADRFRRVLDSESSCDC